MLRTLCWTLALLLSPIAAHAHWCSNIYNGPARLVVKPEKASVYVVPGGGKLRVYLQNNFPYRLMIQMRGVPSVSGYTVTTAPSAAVSVSPGQNVSYLMTVTGATGTLTTGQLNIQVLLTGHISSWWGSTNQQLTDPTTAQPLINGTINLGGMSEQSPALHGGMLLEKFPSATLPTGLPYCGRTAALQLTQWFGYRFCYSASGANRCSACPCPVATDCTPAWISIEQFPQDCMRAGVELATRKAKLGSDLQAARDGAVNALKGAGSAEHKCLAAVVGAYLWLGGSTSTFTSELQAAANSVTGACQAAALRILGSGTVSTCTQTAYYDAAACAAAEGLSGNNGPVQSILVPRSGATSYETLFYSYMLAIVTAHRYATAGYVSYYPDAGLPTGDGPVGPFPDTRPPDTRPPDSKKIDAPKTDLPKVDIAVKKDTAQPKVDVAVKKDTAQPKVDVAIKKDLAATKDTAQPKVDLPKVGDNGLLPDGIGPTGDLAAADGTQPTADGTPPKAEATTNPNNQNLEGGCGCRTAGTDARPGTLIFFVLVAFAGLAIRRRRR